MIRRALPATAVAAACIALAACGGGGSSMTSTDRSACDTLNQYGDAAEGGDTGAVDGLYQGLGAAGSSSSQLSKKLDPYAQLVAASAQVIQSGGASPKLGDYVGQMRGVCESLGWKAK